MKTSVYISVLFGFLMVGCLPEQKSTADSQAQAVVDSAIIRGNFHLLDSARVTFDFRDRTYTYNKTKDQFKYTRLHLDSIGTETLDVLTNDGLKRYINGMEHELLDEKRNAYSNSVNSVIYFAFLPYRLNDAAVIKTYLGSVKILDKMYHKIMVTFSQQGGGEDYHDVFIYWFDTEDYSMDFLAYEYETNGGGVRFREAINPRDINGIRIQDYINYKPGKGDDFKLIEIDQYFQQGQLEKLSVIDLKNIQIITYSQNHK